jgi:hypothetical protein
MSMSILTEIHNKKRKFTKVAVAGKNVRVAVAHRVAVVGWQWVRSTDTSSAVRLVPNTYHIVAVAERGSDTQ